MVSFPLPPWVTLLIILTIFGLVLYAKTRSSKKGLSRSTLFISVSEAIGVVLATELCINLLYLWAIEELEFPSGLLKLPDPYVYIALYLLVLLLDFIRVNWKRLKKKAD